MAWGQVGNIRGPQGPQGAAGAKGDPGERGADGTGIQIAGNVANYAALPSNLGLADAGKGYLNDADGKLYIWSGTAFPANGAGTSRVALSDSSVTRPWSLATVSPTATPSGTRAKAMDCCMVGLNVPLVVSPLP